MYNILFVCYGNICRSPMAEMIFKDMIYKNNKRYLISCSSRATSMEEIGNGIYPKAKSKLEEKGIPLESHVAKQFKKVDYESYDYIIVFEEKNKRDLLQILGSDKDNRIHLLREFENTIKEIDDPWYTDDFETAFNDIYQGCKSLYNFILEQGVRHEQDN